MHTRLDRATAAIEEQFRSSTIDELIDNPRNTDRRRLGARPADEARPGVLSFALGAYSQAGRE